MDIVKGFDDQQMIEGQDVIFKAELSVPGGAFKIYYDGQANVIKLFLYSGWINLVKILNKGKVF